MTHDTSVLVNYGCNPQTVLQYQLIKKWESVTETAFVHCATATNYSGFGETEFISAGD
jgi:hypothetical protein